jgi:hypothetical protein
MNLTVNLQRVIQMHMMRATDVDMMMDGLEENILVLILQLQQVQAQAQQLVEAEVAQQVQVLVRPLVVDQQQQVQAAVLQVEVTYMGTT